MIYKIRLRISNFLFKIGKQIHPDIAALRKEIAETQRQMNMFCGVK